MGSKIVLAAAAAAVWLVNVPLVGAQSEAASPAVANKRFEHAQELRTSIALVALPARRPMVALA